MTELMAWQRDIMRAMFAGDADRVIHWIEANIVISPSDEWESTRKLVEGLMNDRDEGVALIADIVAKCTDYGSQDGGFVAAYIMPTGPIHRAIPWLQAHGRTVRPGHPDDNHQETP